MGTGNLEGKVVGPGFWPGCMNCQHYEKCQVKPVHLAFPHRWQWGYESVEVDDERVLVLVSWVGSSNIGAAHTGCKCYEVAAQFTVEPDERERRILELDREYRRLEAQLTRRQNSHVERKCEQIMGLLMEAAGVA